ncbi:transposase [Bradyrhizobium sp. STM 3566]
MGLSLSDPAPDHSTLWRFRERLGKTALAERTFASGRRGLSWLRLEARH